LFITIVMSALVIVILENWSTIFQNRTSNQIPYSVGKSSLTSEGSIWYRVDTKTIHVKTDSGILVFKFDHLEKNEKN
jgi:hypothetical protein